jgi:pyrroline-5-carboxylate reductase
MNIAIFGVGNMGRAIIGGLERACGSGVRIAAWDRCTEAFAELCDANVVEVIAPRNWKTADFVPEVLILSVKPADIPGLLDDTVVPAAREQGLDFLTISVAAGVTIRSIREKLGDGARICRVMPNTPVLIGEGMSAYSLSDSCSPADAGLVERIFSACGRVVGVDENLMDAVTGLSGSGPAFVYSFIEALAEGGVSSGLSYKAALDLAAQTVVGAAKMVQETGEHPSVLRSRVMSPGGTTVAGLRALERGAFRDAVMSAVAEAAARSANRSAGAVNIA